MAKKLLLPSVCFASGKGIKSYITPNCARRSSRKMTAGDGASVWRVGWSDLAAIGRVKIYGCSYVYDM